MELMSTPELKIRVFTLHAIVAMARLLINRGAQLEAVDMDGQNALYCAAENAELEVCLFFVSRGLDPNIAENEGETALTM